MPWGSVDHSPPEDDVLRLTEITETGRGLTLRVEGSIVASGATLLETECLAATRRSERVQLDLAGVVYVDWKGLQLLARLTSQRCELLNCPPLVRDLLDEGVEQ